MHVYQCPQCEIRFLLPNELKDHLELDHATFSVMANSVEDDLLGACHCKHHRHHAAA